MIKKVLLLILALCLLFSCTACSASSSKANGEANEIAESMVGKTYRGWVVMEDFGAYGADWEMTWKFKDGIVEVIKDSETANGAPYTNTAEYNYKISGDYNEAYVVFPDSHAWNDLKIVFNDNVPVTLIHTDSVGTSDFDLVN